MLVSGRSAAGLRRKGQDASGAFTRRAAQAPASPRSACYQFRAERGRRRKLNSGGRNERWMPTTSRTYAWSTTTIGALILRDDWTCCYCGRQMDEACLSSLVFDHVEPRTSPTCSTSPRNVVVACQGCNIWKGDSSVAEVFPEALPEIARRTAISIGRRSGPRAAELRRLGRELGDRLYPWAAEYRAREAEKSLARYHRRRTEALARGIRGGSAFPFGVAHDQ